MAGTRLPSRIAIGFGRGASPIEASYYEQRAAQVRVAPELGTIVWPNDVDLDSDGAIAD
jgi:hypothetical protein